MFIVISSRFLGGLEPFWVFSILPLLKHIDWSPVINEPNIRTAVHAVYFIASARVSPINNGAQESSIEPDRVSYYGHTVLELIVFLMNWIDAVRKGDGERCNFMKKQLMLYFKVQSAYSKYAIEMCTNIAQTEYLMSHQIAHRVIVSFVNWREGAGNNMGESSKYARVTKNVVQGIGPNKTKATIKRASKAVAGIHEVATTFDENSGRKPESHAHTKMSSKEDEYGMIKDQMKLKPFDTVPRHKHNSFPCIPLQ